MLRFYISTVFSLGMVPLSTLIVNVLGSFFIGVLYILRQNQILIFSETVHLALMVGFLGAFTTFSSFSLESLQFIQSGSYVYFMGYVMANVFFCLVAVYFGIRLTGLFV